MAYDNHILKISHLEKRADYINLPIDDVYKRGDSGG